MDKSLAQALSSQITSLVDDYVTKAGDAGYLGSEASNGVLASVSGVVSVAGIRPLIKYTGMIEKVIAGVVSGSIAREAGVGAVKSAMTDISSFFADYAFTGNPHPIALGDTYESMASLAGEKNAFAGTLFMPSFVLDTYEGPRMVRKPLTPEQMTDALKIFSTAYQAGLLAYVKTGDVSNISAMRQALQAYEIKNLNPGFNLMIDAGITFLGSIRDGAGSIGKLEINFILSRMERDISKSIGDGQASEDTVSLLLYHITRLNDESARAQRLVRALSLRHYLAASFRVGMDAELISGIERAMASSQAAVEGVAKADVMPRDAAESFEALFNAAKPLGDFILTGLLHPVMEVMKAVVAGKIRNVGNELYMEMSSSLVIAENRLGQISRGDEHMGDPKIVERQRSRIVDAANGRLIDDGSRREVKSDDSLIKMVFGEMRAEALRMEEAVGRMGTPEYTDADTKVIQASLATIGGALTILDDASAIEAHAIAEGAASNPAVFPGYASLLSLYIDSMANGDRKTASGFIKSILDPDGVEAGKEEPAKQLGNFDAAFEDELRDIFVEEADEVTRNLMHMLASAEQSPATANLISIRRAFHTLKGSGRQCGLELLGEASSQVEQLMNHWNANKYPCHQSLVDFLRKVTITYTGWIDELKRDGKVYVDFSDIQKGAAVLAEWKPAAASQPAPVVEVVKAPVAAVEPQVIEAAELPAIEEPEVIETAPAVFAEQAAEEPDVPGVVVVEAASIEEVDGSEAASENTGQEVSGTSSEDMSEAADLPVVEEITEAEPEVAVEPEHDAPVLADVPVTEEIPFVVQETSSVDGSLDLPAIAPEVEESVNEEASQDNHPEEQVEVAQVPVIEEVSNDGIDGPAAEEPALVEVVFIEGAPDELQTSPEQDVDTEARDDITEEESNEATAIEEVVEVAATVVVDEQVAVESAHETDLSVGADDGDSVRSTNIKVSMKLDDVDDNFGEQTDYVEHSMSSMDDSPMPELVPAAFTEPEEVLESEQNLEAEVIEAKIIETEADEGLGVTMMPDAFEAKDFGPAEEEHVEDFAESAETEPQVEDILEAIVESVDDVQPAAEMELHEENVIEAADEGIIDAPEPVIDEVPVFVEVEQTADEVDTIMEAPVVEQAVIASAANAGNDLLDLIRVVREAVKLVREAAEGLQKTASGLPTAAGLDAIIEKAGLADTLLGDVDGTQQAKPAAPFVAVLDEYGYYAANNAAEPSDQNSVDDSDIDVAMDMAAKDESPEDRTDAPAEEAVDSEPTLFDLFLEESSLFLNVLNDEFERFLDTGHVTNDLVRSSHTLGSISATVGVMETDLLCHAFERWACINAGGIWKSETDVLKDAVEMINTCVDRIRESGAENLPDVTDVVNRINALCDGPSGPDGGRRNDEESVLVDAEPEDPEPEVDLVPSVDVEAAAEEVVVAEAENEEQAADAVAEGPVAEEAAQAQEVVLSEKPEQATSGNLDSLKAYLGIKDIDDQIDADFYEVFREEADEISVEINGALDGMREDHNNRGALDALKRALHTIKGGARMAGAMMIGSIFHSIEDTIDKAAIRGGIDRECYGYLNDGCRIGLLMVNGASITDAASEYFGGGSVSTASAARQDGEVRKSAGAVAKKSSGKSVRIEVEKIDNMAKVAGQSAISLSIARRATGDSFITQKNLSLYTDRLRELTRELDMQVELQMQSRRQEAEDSGEEFDPLEMDRFTKSQETMRKVMEAVNDINESRDQLDGNFQVAINAMEDHEMHTGDLHESLIGLRVVSLFSMVGRFRRIVEQACIDAGKKARLEVFGDVNLDRSVFEKVTAAMEHVLRNAVAHGIESPDRRLEAGKQEEGVITVTAAMDGGEAIITIVDDGGGINLDVIRRKGIEKGLVKADESMTEQEILDILFMPGFSTAENVTELSGRGVGMDVVKKDIGEIGGRIDIGTRLGQGSTFAIHAPSDLAIAPALPVKVDGKWYVIPTFVINTIESHRFVKHEGPNVIINGESFIAHDISTAFGFPPKSKVDKGVYVAIRGSRIAVHVDEMFPGQDFIIRDIGKTSGARGCLGATVMTDGTSAPIINPALFDYSSESRAAASSAVNVARKKIVMVVDDSMTVRKVSERFLLREGFAVVVAEDGQDAMNKLMTAETLPDIMLMDIEMPNKNGFEALDEIRGNQRLSGIPVVMISSRAVEKHRDHAISIGANGYIGKPYKEQDVLAEIGRLTTREMAKAA